MPLGIISRPRPRRLCLMGTSYPRKKAQPHPILAHVYCVRTAAWIMMPLGTEVNLGLGDVVLDVVAAPPKRGTAPSFRFMSIVAKRLDGEVATWYGSRPRPTPHCVRRGPSSPPRKGHSSPPLSAHGYCGHSHPSQLLLSSCPIV